MWGLCSRLFRILGLTNSFPLVFFPEPADESDFADPFELVGEFANLWGFLGGRFLILGYPGFSLMDIMVLPMSSLSPWQICHDCPVLLVSGIELFDDGGPFWLPEVVSSGVPDDSPSEVFPEAHPNEESPVLEPSVDMAAAS